MTNNSKTEVNICKEVHLMSDTGFALFAALRGIMKKSVMY